MSVKNNPFMNRNTLANQAPLDLPQTSAPPHSRPLLNLLRLLPLLMPAFLGTTQLSGQTADTSYSPLLLYTNTGGKVVPLHDGQMLNVGKRYRMAAVPNPGFAFTNWTLVYAFTFSTVVINEDGTQSTVSSTNFSEVPDYSTRRVLKFTNQAPEVIIDLPNITITQAIGWRPEFVPRPARRSKTKPPQQ